MTRILALFLDGIGLGEDDPQKNPFAAADMPTILELTGGRRWLAKTGRQHTARAVFIPTDARLGIPGLPQSGTGQASLLTGLNVPQITGRHYGPKPDLQTRRLIAKHSYFKRLVERGKKAQLLTAYPPRLLHDFERGKTLRSSIQQAAYESGQAHFTVDDVRRRQALTAEWTTESWRKHLKIDCAARYSAREAGRLLARLARNYDFAFHSHWLTDRIGHRGPLARGVELLEMFDQVLRRAQNRPQRKAMHPINWQQKQDADQDADVVHNRRQRRQQKMLVRIEDAAEDAADRKNNRASEQNPHHLDGVLRRRRIKTRRNGILNQPGRCDKDGRAKD